MYVSFHRLLIIKLLLELTFVVLQGHIYNSTSRIRNRKEKKSWLGYAQVGEYLTVKQTFLPIFQNMWFILVSSVNNITSV